MSITVAEIKAILRKADVKFLYHANTVATSETFFQNGGLLSRGAVQKLGLFQTRQKSDSLDKQLGVFYDIFFDSVDIHARAGRLNEYGPITFVYSIDVLDTLDRKEVKVTKDNPIYWNEHTPENERYFTKITEMKNLYKKGTFKQHLTICDMHKPLAFSSYLTKVIIDNPNTRNAEYFDKASKAIQKHLDNNRLDAPLEVRQCPSDCKCQEKYKAYQSSYLNKGFELLS